VTDVPRTTTSPLFERLGGRLAVAAAVDRFYDRVLADERIASFFDGVDMERQKNKQRAFLTFAFGGPNAYTGLRMREGHAHLVERGLDDGHVDAVVENLSATLDDLGVEPPLIDEVVAICESVRDEVLGRA